MTCYISFRKVFLDTVGWTPFFRGVGPYNWGPVISKLEALGTTLRGWQSASHRGLWCLVACSAVALGRSSTEKQTQTKRLPRMMRVVKTILVPSFLLSCKWVYLGSLYWHQLRETHTVVDFPLPKCTYRKWWHPLRHLDVEIYDICPMLFEVGATIFFFGLIVETCLCWHLVTSWC